MRGLLREVDLHLTNRCNLSCIHCNANSPLLMDELPGDMIIRFLEDASRLGARDLHVTGGEPFLREDIWEILHAAVNSFRMDVEIVTNATILSENDIARIHEVGIKFLAFSLDGLRVVNDAMRAKGSYDIALGWIQEASKIGLKTRVNTAVCRQNREEVKDLLRETCGLNVGKHVLLYFTPMGRAVSKKDLWLTPIEWKEFKNEIASYVRANLSGRKTTIMIQEGYVFDSNKPSNCTDLCRMRAREFCLLMCDGRVYPCVLFMHSPYILGNINECRLTDIWLNSEAWELMDTISCPLQCGDCRLHNICGGGCKGYSYLLGGNLELPDPRCDIANGIVPSCLWRTVSL